MLGLEPARPQCSRRVLLTRGGPVVGAMITAACGAAGTAPPSTKTLSDAPVTIEFYKRGTLQDADVNIMLQEWYERHPTWKVNLTQGKNDLAALTPAIAGGEKIDVLGWYQTVRGLIASTGIPLPLEDYVKRDKYDVSRFSAKELDLVGRYRGKLYALYYAWGGNLTAMYYNRTLFQQAGVPEPPADWSKAWTWEQFREALHKLTIKQGTTTTQVGITDYGDPITSLLVLSDAKWISDDWKKIDPSAPELLQTLERWAEITAKDGSAFVSPGVDLGTKSTLEAFMTGRAAIHNVCCGPANPAMKFRDAGMDWGFMPTPKMKYAAPDVQSNLVLLAKLGEHPDHGWELTKYLIENNRWGAREGRLPPFVEDAQKWVKETFTDMPNARLELVWESIKFARPVDKIKYHPAGDELYGVIKPVLADIWAGRATVRAALPPMQSQLQAILDRTPMPE